MDDQSLLLVRKSFLRLIPVAEIAEKVFYEHLTLLEPELGADYGQDELAAWRALARIIECVPHDGRMPRYAARIGFLYAKRGLSPKRYRSVEQALLWTVRHLPHEAMDERAIGAWRQLFANVEHHMKSGAREYARVARQNKIRSGR